MAQQQSEQQSQDRPLAGDQVSALPTHTVTAADLGALGPEARSCAICMEDFNAGDEWRTLPCFHRFHKACVDQWFRRQGNCPICKHEVSGGGDVHMSR